MNDDSEYARLFLCLETVDNHVSVGQPLSSAETTNLNGFSTSLAKSSDLRYRPSNFRAQPSENRSLDHLWGYLRH